MVWLENECVGCDLPCLRGACELSSIEHYGCDQCGEELDADDLYDYDGQCLCAECILSHFDKFNFD